MVAEIARQRGRAGKVSEAAADSSASAGEGMFWLVWVYLMFEFVRPQDLFGTSAFAIPFVVSSILVVYWLGKGDKTLLKDPVIRGCIIFVAAMAVSIVSVRNHSSWFHDTRAILWYLLAFILPCATYVATPERLGKLLKAFVVFNTITAVYVIMHKGVGQGGPLTDENDVALVLIMALPYAWFLAQSPRNSGVQKTLFLIAAAVIMAGAVATKSRGGFLGLGAVVFSIFLLSPNKVRNFVLGLIVVAVVLASAPKEFWDRMGTITESETGSGEERLYHWGRGVEMFLDYPILGIGAGNYPWRMAEYQLRDEERRQRQGPLLGGRQAHSVYITVLSELGTIGTIVFFWITVKVFGKIKDVLTKLREQLHDKRAHEMFLLARAMQFSMFGFLVSGTFISVLYYVDYWYLIGLIVALERAARHLEPVPIGNRKAGSKGARPAKKTPASTRNR